MNENSLSAETTFRVELRGIYINLPAFIKPHLLKSHFDLIGSLNPNVILTPLIYQGLPICRTAATLKYKLPGKHYLFKRFDPWEIVFSRARRDQQFVWGHINPLSLAATDEHRRRWLNKIGQKFKRWVKRNEQGKPITSETNEPLLCYANLLYRRALAEICYECLEAHPFTAVALDFSSFSSVDLEAIQAKCYCQNCRQRLKAELGIHVKSARKGLSSEALEKWQKWLAEELVAFFTYIRARWQRARHNLIFNLMVDKKQLHNQQQSVLSSLIHSQIFDEIIIKGFSARAVDIHQELVQTLTALPDYSVVLPLILPESTEEWIGAVKATRDFPLTGTIIAPQFAITETEIGDIKSEIYSEMTTPPEHNVLEAICEILKLIIGQAQPVPEIADFFRSLQKSFTPEKCLIPFTELEAWKKNLKEMENKATCFKGQYPEFQMLPRNIKLLLKLLNFLTLEKQPPA